MFNTVVDREMHTAMMVTCHSVLYRFKIRQSVPSDREVPK